MSDYQEITRNAENTLHGSSDPAQRSRALEELKRVVQEADGVAAREAFELIVKYSVGLPVSRDREIEDYARRWMLIMGLTDPRLLDLLQELKDHPVAAARLRSEVVSSIRRWIEEVVVRAQAEIKAKEIKLLKKFVDVISEIEIYSIELEELALLRMILFRVRYQEISQKIHDALRVWAINEAWNLLGMLDNPPSNFQEEVDELQKQIYDVSDIQQIVESLLAQASKSELVNWTDANQIVRHAQELVKCLGDKVIPPPWRTQLQQQMEKSLSLTVQFLKLRAAAAGNFNGIREFWKEFENLQVMGLQTQLAPQSSWLQSFLDGLLETLQRDVMKAASPARLREVYNYLKQERVGLPAFIVDAVDSLANEVNQYALTWERMRAGEEFAVPDAFVLPPPGAFMSDALIFGDYIKKIKEELAKIHAPETTGSEQPYLNGLSVADSILKEHPSHRFAATLKREVEQRIVSLRIEAALVQWEFDRLIELCKTQSGKREFDYYIKNETLLRDWLEPYVKQEKFSDWNKAALWWLNLRTAIKKLPKPFPASLDAAIRHEQERRRDQWYIVLQGLLKQELTPEQCLDIEKSLEDELEEASALDGYRKMFKRKGAIGKAYHFIQEKEWKDAQDIINDLNDDSTEIRRLKTNFEVERAREQGVAALADIFESKWSAVRDCVDNPTIKLLDAIEEAWENNLSDALEKLRRAAMRILLTESEPAEQLNQLRSWDDWLKVEQAVLQNESSASLRRLISYMRENEQPDELLKKRLERLVTHWNAQDNLTMLAWASQVFDALSLDKDPVQILMHQSDEVADRILKDLSSRDDMQRAELEQMQDNLNSKESDWKNLNEYLDLAPRRILHLRPSEGFVRAKDSISNLLEVMTSLEQLAEADLRETALQDKLDTVNFILTKRLGKVAMKKRLLAEAGRLDPLAKLQFIEKHIQDAARKCHSEDYLYEVGVLAELSEKIRELNGKFKRANAEGGYMWSIVSKDYCDKVYRLACIWEAKSYSSDLRSLAEKLKELEAREQSFRKVLEQLWETKPVFGAGGAFDPEKHKDYLRRFPQPAPLTWRDYRYFENRLAKVEPLETIIRQSRDKLPEWIGKYLDEGIPSCADEL